MPDAATAPRRGRPRKTPARLGPELARLRAARLADARTDAELAAAAGIHRETLSNLLSGRDRPLFDNVAAVVAALGLSWSILDASAEEGASL